MDVVASALWRGHHRRRCPATRRGALAAALAFVVLGAKVLALGFFGDPQPQTREPPPRRPWPRTAPGGKLSAWEVLEVAPGATKEDIKLAYLQKAKSEHPDRRPGDKDAVEKFVRINAAYKELMEGPSSQLYSEASNPQRYAAPAAAQSSSAMDDDTGNVYLAGVASSLVVMVYFALFESSERLPLVAYILSIWLAVLALIPSKKSS